MGEEKPDEELMGKRKSSPRLSTASSDADDFILSGLWAIIHFTPKKILRAPGILMRCLYNPRESVVR